MCVGDEEWLGTTQPTPEYSTLHSIHEFTACSRNGSNYEPVGNLKLCHAFELIPIR